MCELGLVSDNREQWGLRKTGTAYLPKRLTFTLILYIYTQTQSSLSQTQKIVLCLDWWLDLPVEDICPLLMIPGRSHKLVAFKPRSFHIVLCSAQGFKSREIPCLRSLASCGTLDYVASPGLCVSPGNDKPSNSDGARLPAALRLLLHSLCQLPGLCDSLGLPRLCQRGWVS